jgi:hypothetical protein
VSARGGLGLGYSSTSKKILKFESFDQIGIPNHTTVSNSNVCKSFINFGDFFDAILQRLFRTKDSDITFIIISPPAPNRSFCVFNIFSAREITFALLFACQDGFWRLVQVHLLV